MSLKFSLFPSRKEKILYVQKKTDEGKNWSQLQDRAGQELEGQDEGAGRDRSRARVGGGECELLRKNVRRNMQLRSCLQRKKPNIFHGFFLGGTG